MDHAYACISVHLVMLLSIHQSASHNITKDHYSPSLALLTLPTMRAESAVCPLDCTNGHLQG